MIDVNLVCVFRTVFTTTLLTPVKIEFLATFKQPVITTFKIGAVSSLVFLGVLFSTPKKELISSTISSWYLPVATFANGTSYSSISRITCLLKCLYKQELKKLKAEVRLFWLIGSFKYASLHRFFKSNFSSSVRTSLF